MEEGDVVDSDVCVVVVVYVENVSVENVVCSLCVVVCGCVCGVLCCLKFLKKVPYGNFF